MFPRKGVWARRSSAVRTLTQRPDPNIELSHRPRDHDPIIQRPSVGDVHKICSSGYYAYLLRVTRNAETWCDGACGFLKQIESVQKRVLSTISRDR